MLDRGAAAGLVICSSGLCGDDDRFGLISEGGRVSVAGNDPVVNQTFIAASAGLVGYDNFRFATAATRLLDSGLPLDMSPEFARPGIWSASLSGAVDAETGLAREDIVHADTWAAGVAPDKSLIPDTGIVSDTGVAVGTAHNLDTGSTRFVDGTFGLDFGFGQRTGDFRLDVDSFSFGTTAQNAIGVPGDPSRYTVTDLSRGTDIMIRGGFLAGGGDPLAAPAGDFDIRTRFFVRRQIVGVFAGDAVT